MTGPNGSGFPFSSMNSAAVRMISSERASHSALVAPHAVLPCPPRMTPMAWVPWRRPGFQLGLDIAAIAAASPQAIGVILGGHGITAWGATSAECEARGRDVIRTAAEFIEANGKPDPFGPVIAGYEPLPEAGRRARAAE